MMSAEQSKHYYQFMGSFFRSPGKHFPPFKPQIFSTPSAIVLEFFFAIGEELLHVFLP